MSRYVMTHIMNMNYYSVMNVLLLLYIVSYAEHGIGDTLAAAIWRCPAFR